MTQPTTVHNTFTIERNYPVSVERLFAALSDPEKKRRWYAADSAGTEVDHYESDFRVGGVERAHYRFKSGTPFPGAPLTNDGSYQDIVPNRRVVIASTMAIGGKHISSTLVTFELLRAENGTDLILTHQGAFYEGGDGPQMRQNGWETLLGRLSEWISAETNRG